MAESKFTRTVVPTLTKIDEVMGYAGTIQCGMLEGALYEQCKVIWAAQSIVDMVAGALGNEFGNSANWPAKLPNFPLALREVSRMLENVTSNLESETLENRALEKARLDIEQDDAMQASDAAAAEASHG